MEDNNPSLREKLENLATHTRELGETGYKLALLEVTEKATKMVSNIVIILMIFFFLNALSIFLGFALAYWLNEVFNSHIISFAIVAGIYLFLITLMIVLRKKVILPLFVNFVIKRIYE